MDSTSSETEYGSYTCSQCHKRTDKLFKGTGEFNTVCEKCRNENLYWEARQPDSHDDWGGDKTFLESYRESVNHPHRQLILDYLKDKEFSCVLEVGCCNAPNLYLIAQAYPNISLMGEDVNSAAIADAKLFLPDALFRVCKLPDISLD